ncbi:ABC transporter ATP-binding protein [Stackebrandtia nassauensis]|uniref:ABC transporter related protein n=1 Tax=Stackebrandtia nassauensis (strain DSM 44728 / CIP 108903 / NRRL B-16338 / NBRC 102104 / LLR-40K-21) TaxID=446470 RepID=D3Q3D7_STANL|nr:ABC transporter ATP-binding protein [Stackebrandtia nassauensis]ADD41978.1 ABC transporter related protein [Stackebrandtia nassauensis DSM 44728]
MTTVELKNVSKVFAPDIVAVDDLNLSVNNGEFMVLLGPSGCGKSTILRMLAGLEDTLDGDILLNGEFANHLTPRERGVAMVFQNFALYPHFRVADNIGFPLRIAGVDAATIKERTVAMAASLGIEDLLDRKPHQLSGGQRQRVAMGRALIRHPRFLLMDEPLSNLDIGLRSQLRTEIVEMAHRLNITTVYVTHDQTEALTMADRVAVLRRGRLQDVGSPDQVYDKPATMYVAAFLGNPRMNLVRAYVEVHLDRYVTLHLGSQSIRLPWSDLQSRGVSKYHGEQIVVGIRAEAVRPVSHDRPNVLNGLIQFMEHHGHESLVHLRIGAVPVDHDAHSQQPESGRHNKQISDVTVRLAPYSRCRPGQAMSIEVHTDLLHFFDSNGNRIEAVQRR